MPRENEDVRRHPAAATPDCSPWNDVMYEARRGTSTRRLHRSSYAVDRDRILYSASFRDLAEKTQVQSAIYSGQLHRPWTRLNHVIEVASLARGLATTLGANGELAEAIALAHDLGHPPFGHAGEAALDRMLRESGYSDGWNANAHSLAVVDEIERAFRRERGLNLTYATREGIARHTTPFDIPIKSEEFATPQAGVEAQIVDIADVLVYVTHDLADALIGEYLGIDDAASSSPAVAEIVEDVERQWRDRNIRIWPRAERIRFFQQAIRAIMIKRAVEDVARTSSVRLNRRSTHSPEGVRAAHERCVEHSEEWKAAIKGVLATLKAAYYRSADVVDADQKAGHLVEEIFTRLMNEPALVPVQICGSSALRVARFIAGLTDNGAAVVARHLGVEVNGVREPTSAWSNVGLEWRERHAAGLSARSVVRHRR